MTDQAPEARTSPSRKTSAKHSQHNAKRRRTQEERTTETTRTLIQATIDLVCESGYASVTTAKIAARAKLSRGALQHHFRSRSELMIAVAKHLTDSMLRLGETIGESRLSLDDRVEAAVTHYLSAYLSREYFATLSILVGITNDTEFIGRSRLVNIQKGSDGPWLSLFADQGIDNKDLLVARNITLATLRGMAVARLLGMSNASLKPEADALKAMLIRFFQDKRQPDSLSSKQKSKAARRPVRSRRLQ